MHSGFMRLDSRCVKALVDNVSEIEQIRASSNDNVFD